jgi:hypothetical protein
MYYAMMSNPCAVCFALACAQASLRCDPASLLAPAWLSCRYLCREWNLFKRGRHTPDEEYNLQSFSIIYMREDTLPNYEVTAPQQGREEESLGAVCSVVCIRWGGCANTLARRPSLLS